MVKKNRKDKSKRIKCSRRYQIQRKIRSHLRKVKKEAKMKNLGLNVIKKDPGVPRLHPLKETFLREAEVFMQQKNRNKVMLKRLQVEARKKETLLALTGAKSECEPIDYTIPNSDFLMTRKAFYKDFRQVIDASDVVLEVLDARDPLSGRNKNAELQVISHPHKRLILILNKADLVPCEVIHSWLSYLRKEYPTIAFKSSTQLKQHHLGWKNSNPQYAPLSLKRTSACMGAKTLFHLLSNYCKLAMDVGEEQAGNLKRGITVGLIGCPNVGKSSIINSLVRNKSCKVGAVPGITRNMTKVSLSKHIKLLDCPGLLSSQDSTNQSLSLLGSLTSSGQGDPIEICREIYSRCSVEQLMTLYKLPEFEGGVEEFLAVLAHKNGKLKKKGYPDIGKAAKIIIHDWSVGKIAFYRIPPELPENILDKSANTAQVGQLSDEFDIEALLKCEEAELKELLPANTLRVEMRDEAVRLSESDTEICSDEREEAMDQSEREKYF